MADDTKNTDSGTPQQPDAAPQPPATPPTEPLPQQQPSMGQQVPPAQPQPQQPMYALRSLSRRLSTRLLRSCSSPAA